MFPSQKIFWLSGVAAATLSGAVIFSATANSLQTGSGHPATLSNSSQQSPHPPSSEAAHNHRKLEIPAGQPLPSVTLTVRPDPMRGWNLQVQTANFRFAPEHIMQSSLPSEGHAHLYVDGKKVTRLYSEWYYLENLQPGRREITVSLSTNQHEELTHNGRAIAATEVIIVPSTRAGATELHRH